MNHWIFSLKYFCHIWVTDKNFGQQIIFEVKMLLLYYCVATLCMYLSLPYHSFCTFRQAYQVTVATSYYHISVNTRMLITKDIFPKDTCISLDYSLYQLPKCKQALGLKRNSSCLCSMLQSSISKDNDNSTLNTLV